MTSPEGFYRLVPGSGAPYVMLMPEFHEDSVLRFRYGGAGGVEYLLHDLLTTPQPCLQVISHRNLVEIFIPHEVLDGDQERAYVSGGVAIAVNDVPVIPSTPWLAGEEKVIDRSTNGARLLIGKAGGTRLRVELASVVPVGSTVKFTLKTLEWKGDRGVHTYRHPDPNVVFRVVDDPSTSQSWPGCGTS